MAQASFLGDDFFEVGAFDFLEAGACLVLGDLAAAEAFEVGLTFEVGFAPVASYISVLSQISFATS